MKLNFFNRTGAAIMAAAMVMNATAISMGTTVAAGKTTRYEFEDGVSTGTGSVKTDSKASGGKYFYLESNDDTVTVTVNVASTGMYNLKIGYNAEFGEKIQNLYVNGVDQGQISFTSEDWAEVDCGAVKLEKGDNEVMIKSSWGWTNFDYLDVEEATLSEIKATQTTCCDAGATAETRSLMAYLASVYGKNIISGQQEIYSGGPHGLEQEFEYLKETTGHYPAIRGFDYGNFSCPAFGSDDGSTERVIDWVKNKNGIATASFHLNVPTDFSSYTIGSRIDWSKTTYSEKTDFSPSKAATEGTKENEYYMQALTTLAAEFKKLEAEGIPVIWRPLHEAEGGGGETKSWFWWGREGSEAYKKLWIYTYETLTQKFDCHNLIWEWNSYNYEYSQDWYPGDEYVDIIGYDKYNCTDWSTGSAVLNHNDSAISSTFYGIMNKYNSAKMVSMAENDCFSTVSNLIDEKAGWLYFCTWYDGGSDDINFLTNPMFNTKEDTIEMYQSEYCITLDELPEDLYKKETPAPETTTKTTADPSKTTTTTVITTEADPTKNYGKVVYDKTNKSYQITLPEAVKEFYVDVELPKGIEYANGGMGVSVELDGEYYWANIQWEAKASGAVKVNVVDNFLNCSLGTEVIEDEALIEKIKAELGKSKTYEGQIWYAQEGGKSASTDGVKIVGAYIKKESSGNTTTTTTGGSTVAVKLLGDANNDGEVNIADATAIIQHLGNQDKYGLSEQGLANADCCNVGDGVTGLDALAIQKLEAKMIDKLPDTAE
ncbi:MAG: glycoside hydrolase [Ruminococcus sp.]|nr:glycoside hydrolase [Ruminococcus sp.]